MYCKYCGEQIDDNSKFCKKCGSKLETELNNHLCIPDINFSNFALKEYKLELIFLMFSFAVSIILCFCNWITIRSQSLWSNSSDYSLSLLSFYDIGKYIGEYVNEDSLSVLIIGFIYASLIIIFIEIFAIICFFYCLRIGNDMIYFWGLVSSGSFVILTIWFVFAVMALNDNLSSSTYNMLQVNISISPILILIINIVAFVWLWKNKKSNDSKDIRLPSMNKYYDTSSFDN